MATKPRTPPRAPGGKFLPGQSGNPSGRPTGKRLVAHIVEQTGDGVEVANFLLAVMRGECVRPSTARGRKTYPGYKERIAAARELLERTYGRAPVSVELGGPGEDGQTQVRFTMDIGPPAGESGGDDA